MTVFTAETQSTQRNAEGRELFMLDICAGLKGASQAMQERGWKVKTIDIDPEFKPDICADVLKWSWKGKCPDLIWCSPPCTEFSREFMPWSRTGKTPDLSIYQACMRIIKESQPKYWVIENVRGAVRYFGHPRAVYGPFFLWGFFPDMGKIDLKYRKKESYGSNKAAERAKIPEQISCALAKSIEMCEAIV